MDGELGVKAFQNVRQLVILQYIILSPETAAEAQARARERAENLTRASKFSL